MVSFNRKPFLQVPVRESVDFLGIKEEDTSDYKFKRLSRVSQLKVKILYEFVVNNKYIPEAHRKPTKKQAEFLVRLDREVFFGGAAGGGKSDALLMAALMFVEYPQYKAILFRKTFTDLALPDALMDRARAWLSDTDAKWEDKRKSWVFPSGATLTFAYMKTDGDRYRYQSAQFHFIGFDELTQFNQIVYDYLFSRLRKAANDPIPLRVRSASNPGNIGHDWVKDKFIGTKKFIKSLLTDNPYLNIDDYKRSLAALDPVTRKQLEEGDWDVSFQGNMFKRHWFPIVQASPASYKRKVRFWDLAATEKIEGKNEPDYCTGTLLARDGDKAIVLDVVHVRLAPTETEATIAAVAKADGLSTRIVIEQEGGAAAKLLVDIYKRTILKGYRVEASKPTANKVVRAKLVSAAAGRGEISVVEADWNNSWFSELIGFPDGIHDDQVDSLSGAYNTLFAAGNVSSKGLPQAAPVPKVGWT